VAWLRLSQDVGGKNERANGDAGGLPQEARSYLLEIAKKNPKTLVR
jgi:hypothetical protein